MPMVHQMSALDGSSTESSPSSNAKRKTKPATRTTLTWSTSSPPQAFTAASEISNGLPSA